MHNDKTEKERKKTEREETEREEREKERKREKRDRETELGKGRYLQASFRRLDIKSVIRTPVCQV